MKASLNALFLTLSALLSSTGCAVRAGYYAEPAYLLPPPPPPPPVVYVQPPPERVVLVSTHGYGHVRPFGYSHAHVEARTGHPRSHRTPATPRIGRR